MKNWRCDVVLGTLDNNTAKPPTYAFYPQFWINQGLE